MKPLSQLRTEAEAASDRRKATLLAHLEASAASNAAFEAYNDAIDAVQAEMLAVLAGRAA